MIQVDSILYCLLYHSLKATTVWEQPLQNDYFIQKPEGLNSTEARYFDSLESFFRSHQYSRMHF